MKTTSKFALIALLIPFFMACEKDDFNITPSGDVTFRQHSITSFSELNIADPFDVQVAFSNTEHGLRIEANDNLHAVIEVEQEGGTLTIRLKDNTNIHSGDLVLRAYVTTSDLQSLKASGTAQVHLQDPWNTDQAEIELTGASDLDGEVYAARLEATLTGASNLEISGEVHTFEIEATGGSKMEGFGFETNVCSADLLGASEISVTVHEKLNVKAEGASKVFYQGEGLIDELDLSGSSQVIKM